MEDNLMNNEDSNMIENGNNKEVVDEDAMDIDGGEGSCALLSNLKNENQLLVDKKLETCIVIDRKRQKSGKRVRFAVDDNVEHINRIGRINESSFKHKDCQLNSVYLSEIETMENVKFQTKLLCSNRYSDSYLDRMGYPSKFRHCNFNRLNTNESQQNTFKIDVIRDCSFSKNTKKIQSKRQNDIKIKDELPSATLNHDYSLHENGSKYIDAKDNKGFEVANILNLVEQNNNNSNNIHTIPTYGFSIPSATNFECNGSSGSRTFEDSHTSSLLNITMFKSNLNRIVRRYQMKQKKIEEDKTV